LACLSLPACARVCLALQMRVGGRKRKGGEGKKAGGGGTIVELAERSKCQLCRERPERSQCACERERETMAAHSGVVTVQGGLPPPRMCVCVCVCVCVMLHCH
jgi:hypothetical protein